MICSSSFCGEMFPRKSVTSQIHVCPSRTVTSSHKHGLGLVHIVADVAITWLRQGHAQAHVHPTIHIHIGTSWHGKHTRLPKTYVIYHPSHDKSDWCTRIERIRVRVAVRSRVNWGLAVFAIRIELQPCIAVRVVVGATKLSVSRTSSVRDFGWV